MLGHFEHESALDSFDFEGIEDRRDFSFKLDIDDCSDDLDEFRCTCEICPFLEARGLAASEKAALRVWPRQDLSILAANIK